MIQKPFFFNTNCARYAYVRVCHIAQVSGRLFFVSAVDLPVLLVVTGVTYRRTVGEMRLATICTVLPGREFQLLVAVYQADKLR